jgi:cell division protein FtsI (penicillin-binding protein 3)
VQPGTAGRRRDAGRPRDTGRARHHAPAHAARPARPGWARKTLRRTSSSRRLTATLLSVAFAISVILVRLVQLQIGDAGHYRDVSHRYELTVQSIPAVRGEIAASNGTLLAMTLRTYDIVADPPEITPSTTFAAVAAKLAGPLHMSQAAIVALLQHPTSPDAVTLRSGVIAATEAAIAKLGLPGINPEPVYQRVYPNGDLAAALLGFVDTNQKTGVMTGENGLEEQFNALLAGKPGTEVYEHGSYLQPIPGTESLVKPVIPADSLRLTIQPDIQWEAEHECAIRVAATKARTCTVIVMNPRTGAILAMAQYPTFNPTDPASYAATRNLAVANEFAPGSTAKVITAAAAFQDAGETPLTSYLVPDQFTFRGASYEDAEPHPTQRYTIAGIIAHSLNDGMVQVAAHVPPHDQYAMFRAFGIGSPSGLDLPGEVAGQLPPPSHWTLRYGYQNERYQISFGQSVDVTAIQMASVYATIADGGVRVTPTLVAGHTTAGGQFVPAAAPAARRVISSQAAAELMKILEQVPVVYQHAGESWGIIPGYTVAAKTGTAQEPGNTYGSSFIGIAPATGSGLVVAVNLQDPRRGSNFGIDVAGPVFNAVMKFALAAMKIPPTGDHVPYVPLTAP